MSSIALDLLDAIETRLGAASVVVNKDTKTPPANLTIYRELIGQVTPAKVKLGPIISISRGGELSTSRDHYKSPMLQRMMEVLITVAVLANDDHPSVALDPACVWVIHALQSEPTMGGINHWISEESAEDFYTTFADSEDVVAAREHKLHFAFHTRTDDPEARS